MPKMDGLELLRQIRAIERLKYQKFLMVTSESQRESVDEALEAGVTNYLCKPFTAKALKEKLLEVL